MVPEAGGNVDEFSPQLVRSLGARSSTTCSPPPPRLVRSPKDQPATMLVHTHHRQLLQERLTEKLQDHVTAFRQSWRYDREATRTTLADRWEASPAGARTGAPGT